MESLGFEWDESKDSENARKHGVSFTNAIKIFSDPYLLTFYDKDHSDKEHRLISLGFTPDNRLLVLSYTERGQKIRIIVHEKRQKQRESSMRRKLNNEKRVRFLTI